MQVPALRVAAIRFLNPAPLLYDFEHLPRSRELATRYAVSYTDPARCAEDLQANRADVGLIPVASLTEDLAIISDCTIASLHRVRSIQLILGPGHTLKTVRTVAPDQASRSSLAYTQILFRSFLGTDPIFLPAAAADPARMLQIGDAALLIGDPALLALENREAIEAITGPCTWIDLAEQWVSYTGLPWVAAVWAVRPASVTPTSTAELRDDLTLSRDAGLRNREILVREWRARIALPEESIRRYLNDNIHYLLSRDCIRGIELFRKLAFQIGVLPPLATLRFLGRSG